MSEEYKVTPDTRKAIKKLVYENIMKDMKGDDASELDTDRGLLVLTYLSTENLVEYSKTLSIWTIVIGVSTVLLFISAVIQLILPFCV